VAKIGQQQVFGQAGGLLAENKIGLFRVIHIRIHALGLRFKKEKGPGIFREKIVQAFIICDIQHMPIIQARPFELFIVRRKAHWLHQVQASARGGAGAGYVASVLRNFRFKQNQIQLIKFFQFIFLRISVMPGDKIVLRKQNCRQLL